MIQDDKDPEFEVLHIGRDSGARTGDMGKDGCGY